MKLKEIYNFTEYSAYSFLNEEYIKLLLSECKDYPKTTDDTEIITWLINEYGSDNDVIQTILNKKYPSNKYFWLCDYIDYNKYDDSYFWIRIWELDN